MDTLEGQLALVVGFLSQQGFHDTVDSLRREARLPDLAASSATPSLATVIDEWLAWRAVSSAPLSPQESSVRLAALGDDGEEGARVRRVDVRSPPCTSNVLSCAFVGPAGLPYYGEANGTLHCMDGFRADPVPGVGGVLCIAGSRMHDVAVCGTMGGQLLLFRGPTLVHTHPAHVKYAHRCTMSPNGQWVASASHDRTVRFFALDPVAGALALRHHVALATIPEAVAFVGNDTVLVAARETNLLRRVHVSDWSVDELNLNQLGDDHVGFSVLDMAVHPSEQRLVALATDRDRIFLYQLADEAASLVGALVVRSDSFAQTRIAWSPHGAHLYSTERDCASVCVFDVRTQHLIERLTQHSAAVRDIAMRADGSLLSASFDKTAAVWNEHTI